jgi:hypothetical protein
MPSHVLISPSVRADHADNPAEKIGVFASKTRIVQTINQAMRAKKALWPQV